jgi:hypothetical protein
MQWYVDRVVALSTESAVVRDGLLRVFNLLEGPQTLFHPQIVLRIISGVFNQTMRGLPMSPMVWSETK